MRIQIAIATWFVVLGQTVHAQLTLNAGNSYTYSFTSLPGPTAYLFPAALDDLVCFTLNPSSLPATHTFTFETWEKPTEGSLIFSRTAAGSNFNPFIGDGPGDWRDLQGAVPLSVGAGSVTLDQVQVLSFFNEPPIGLDFYSTTVVPPVPEPGLPALAGVAGLALWLWSRIRRIKAKAA